MRSYQCFLMLLLLTVPMLSGCWQKLGGESTTNTVDNHTSEPAPIGSAISIGAALSSISFGGATFDTATWQ